MKSVFVLIVFAIAQNAWSAPTPCRDLLAAATPEQARVLAENNQTVVRAQFKFDSEPHVCVSRLADLRKAFESKGITITQGDCQRMRFSFVASDKDMQINLAVQGSFADIQAVLAALTLRPFEGTLAELLTK